MVRRLFFSPSRSPARTPAAHSASPVGWRGWSSLARPEQAGYGHWPLGVPLGSAASGYSSYCLLFSFTAPGLSVALAAAAERGAWVGVWVCLRSSVPRVLGVGGASLSDSTRQDVEDLSILSFPNIFIFFTLIIWKTSWDYVYFFCFSKAGHNRPACFFV
jgi:hypothetical protein